jgi:SP family sugar:H+ symporter-like MFS transporter
MYLSGYPAWRSSAFKKAQEEAAIKSHEKHYSRSMHREGPDSEGKSSQQTSARTSAEVDAANVV